MSRVRQVKTTFTAGEVSRKLLGRGDLRAYENGALNLRNLFIHPTGGISRRDGLYYVDTLAGEGRLIDFEFNTQQVYLIVLTDEQMDIYENGTKIETLVTPWTEEQIKQLNWTQSADTLLICHPDVEPRQLTRLTNLTWELTTGSFYTSQDDVEHMPFYSYSYNDQMTVTPESTAGTYYVNANGVPFQAEHVGTRMRIYGKQVKIVGYQAPNRIQVEGVETLPSTDATTDWDEQAFADFRGWPISAAFHQDRLVIGGSKSLPNRLWFSKSGNLWNFDLGEGLDDEGIEFAILSDQVNSIRNLFSGRHLQVFTSGAEWRVSGDPLTPQTVQLNRQTRVGSLVDRTVPPVDVDGATIFAARTGSELREFIFTDIEQAYQSNDLALVASHIIKDPVDQAFDKKNRLLHLVLDDGTLATLTIYRAEQVSAWTLQETDGKFLSVSVVGETVYFMVERNGNITLETFDAGVMTDSALIGESETPKSTWTGLDHLEGKTVSIVADGEHVADKIVASGSVTLDAAASDVVIGLSYTHRIGPLPPSAISTSGSGRAVRLVEAIFRLEDTQKMTLDVGRGLKSVVLDPYGDGSEPVSGDIRVSAYGWRRSLTESLWSIEQSDPFPFTLLSVTTEVKVND